MNITLFLYQPPSLLPSQFKMQFKVITSFIFFFLVARATVIDPSAGRCPDCLPCYCGFSPFMVLCQGRKLILIFL